MSAAEDHPFGTLNRYDQWVAMVDEIDSLRADVERLEIDIDVCPGLHSRSRAVRRDP